MNILFLKKTFLILEKNGVNISESFIEIASFKTHFLIARLKTGSDATSPIILIVPGIDGAGETWQTGMMHFAQRGYTVICPDVPGTWKTRYSKGGQAFMTPKLKLAWFTELLNKLAETSKQYIFLCHSAGGHLGAMGLIDYLRDHQADCFIKGMILHTPSGLTNEMPAWFGKMRNWYYFNFFLRPWVILKKYKSDDFARMYRYVLKDHHKELRTIILTSTTKDGNLLDKLVVNQPDLSELSKRIKLYFILSSNDKYFPQAYGKIKALAAQENLILRELETGDHYIHRSDPKRFSKLVLEIIDQWKSSL